MNPTDWNLYSIPLESSDIDQYSYTLSSPLQNPVHVLARGIASSPLWSAMPGGVLIVRQFPPMIAVLGNFTSVEEARLEALVNQITYALRTFRYVSYASVIEDCRVLSSLLEKRFGKEELKQYSFAALPRGGLIVLGILSYLLDLEPRQLESPYASDTPLVVVDDCAITGLRFGDFLKNEKNRNIIFAPLYSHPALRAAIETTEPRVIGCFSANDLSDFSADVDSGNQTFQEVWHARFGGNGRYWIGLPEYLCFPWNEPDRPFWNPVNEKVECGWRILPQELCLKNRAPGIPVYIQPESGGPLRPTDQVIFAVTGNSVVIGDLIEKECYGLEGAAAEIWNAIVKYGDRGMVIPTLLGKFDCGEEDLRKDVDDFIETLTEKGILEQSDEGEL
jgi:hypothetical protein